MILIFNGMLGTNIDNIARYISIKLNKNLDNIKIDVDSENSLKLSVLNDGKYIDLGEFISKHESEDIGDKINYLKRLDNSQNIISLGTNFIYSYFYDIGIDTKEEFLNEFPDFKVRKASGVKDYSPGKIKEMHNESGLEYFVISGQIGKNYIDEIIKEFGKENVQIYNIKRHPTISHTCFKLFKRYNDSYYKPFLYHLDMLNTELLEKEEYITTYKFEDLLADDSIAVNGKKIYLPTQYVGKYKYFAEFEVNDEFFYNSIQKIENFETIYTNEDLATMENINDINEYGDTVMYELIFNKKIDIDNPNLYKNFIKDLGYEELKIENILERI